MRIIINAAAILLLLWGGTNVADAQVRTGVVPQNDSSLVLTLDQALKIALSENVSVKVADREIERSEYAKKGTYASLFPQIDASASYQRTIKKQVMYMDFDISSLGGMDIPGMSDADIPSSESSGGIEVGRWNTFMGGFSAAMPLVNAQLWRSLKISGQDVELAVEKARGSRLETVTQVKKAFYAVLLAKESLKVYEEVLRNAIDNFKQTEKKYNVDKVSELDYIRTKANVSGAIPAVNEAENSVYLSLWQLKAVMGIDLDTDVDVEGALGDYAQSMFYDIHQNDGYNLDGNSTMRQLAIQAEELANTIKLQKETYLPTLSLSFSYMMNAMTNDFKFKQFQWSPYSFAGLSISIPVFSGGKRYSNVKQAEIQYDELKLQTENTERQLRIAIQNYLSLMETDMRSYSSAQETVELASKAYSIAAKSYNIGRNTLTDVNDAQLTLVQAQLNQYMTIYDFLSVKADLEQTLGFDFTEKE